MHKARSTTGQPVVNGRKWVRRRDRRRIPLNLHVPRDGKRIAGGVRPV